MKIESARLLRDDSVLPSMKSEATTLCSFRLMIYTRSFRTGAFYNSNFKTIEEPARGR